MNKSPKPSKAKTEIKTKPKLRSKSRSRSRPRPRSRSKSNPGSPQKSNGETGAIKFLVMGVQASSSEPSKNTSQINIEDR